MSHSELGQREARTRMPSQSCSGELLAKKELPALTRALSPPCRDYAAIVFFANNRFETGKKKLQYLSFGDFAFCAELMIQNWTLGAVGEAPTDPGARTSPLLLGSAFPPAVSPAGPLPSIFPSPEPLPSHPCSWSGVSTHTVFADKAPTTSPWPGASHSTSLTLHFLSVSWGCGV